MPYEDTKKYNYYKLVKINKDEINDLDKTIKYGYSHIDETSILQIEKRENFLITILNNTDLKIVD